MLCLVVGENQEGLLLLETFRILPLLLRLRAFMLLAWIGAVAPLGTDVKNTQLTGFLLNAFCGWNIGGGPSLLSDGTNTGQASIFIPALIYVWHLSANSACSVMGFCCSYLMTAGSVAINLGLSKTASKILFMNAGDSTAFYMLQNSNASKAADRPLSIPFWLAVSVSSFNMLTASSTCTGLLASPSQTGKCSFNRRVVRVVSIFTCCSSKTTWSEMMRKDVLRSSLSSVRKRDYSLSIYSNAASLSVIRRVLIDSTEEAFQFFNSKNGCDTRDLVIAAQHCSVWAIRW